MAQTEPLKQYSEPDYAKFTKVKADYPWWIPNIDKRLTPETKKFLEDYSGVPSDQQSKHVHEIREQAWAIRAYPCTGLGVWLDPYIARSRAYATVLARVKSGGSFVDIGCHLGADMRWLAYDGAPTDQMWGVDIVSHWEVGYELFKDRTKFQGHFIEADVMSDTPALEALYHKADVISIAAVLHQWLWPMQLEAAKRVVQFSKGKGTLVIGYQIGNVEAKEIQTKGMGVSVWRQNPDSFRELWDQVGRETGTKWETQARLIQWQDLGWDPKDTAWMDEQDQVLDFVVERVE